MKNDNCHKTLGLFLAPVMVAVFVLAASYARGQENDFRPFGTVTVNPDHFLNGKGKNIDAPEFWRQPSSGTVWMFVTAKNNKVVERWKLSGASWEEQGKVKRKSRPNGLAVDQEKNWLLIGDSTKKLVEVVSLPDFKHIKNIGDGILRKGETNLDILVRSDGRKIVAVSESKRILGFDLESGKQVFTISPPVGGLEEVAADSFYQSFYVPDESGGGSSVNKGGALFAYGAVGENSQRNGKNIFGQGKFSGDQEGITLYRCLIDGNDSGRGFIIMTNQADKNNNRFEFFDRTDWRHLGTVKINGVSGTDGIDVMEQPLPGHPSGLLAAVNADKDVAVVDFQKVLAGAGLSCR